MTNKNKYLKTIGSTLIVGAFLFLAFGSDDSKSSSSSSSSGSSSSKVTCGYCGRSFDKGTGYNTLMRIINTPESEYSHYCSRKCAQDFLRSN
jgi:ribosomal protein L24E